MKLRACQTLFALGLTAAMPCAAAAEQFGFEPSSSPSIAAPAYAVQSAPTPQLMAYRRGHERYQRALASYHRMVAERRARRSTRTNGFSLDAAPETARHPEPVPVLRQRPSEVEGKPPRFEPRSKVSGVTDTIHNLYSAVFSPAVAHASSDTAAQFSLEELERLLKSKYRRPPDALERF